MSKIFLHGFAVFAALIAALTVSVAVLRFVYPRKYSDYVSEYAKMYGLSENLVYAVIKCESGFREDCASPKGAVGLMQITPETMQWAAMREGKPVQDTVMLNNPQMNIRYGCLIYSLLYEEFSDDSVSLAAYNAGRSAALRWLAEPDYSDDGVLLKSIPYPETEAYVKKVLRVKTIYELLY